MVWMAVQFRIQISYCHNDKTALPVADSGLEKRKYEHVLQLGERKCGSNLLCYVMGRACQAEQDSSI